MLRVELEKLFYSRLLYASLALFMVYAVVMISGFRTLMRSMGESSPDRQSGSMFLYISFSLAFYPLVATIASVFAGGSVSQELRAGTLRYSLITPISRWEYLLAKYLTLVVAVTVTMLFLFVVLAGIGTLLFGAGNVVSYDIWGLAKEHRRQGTLFNEEETLQRCLLALPLAIESALAVASPAFLVSTLVASPLLAISIPLSLFFISSIIQFSPFLTDLKPYLPTRNMFFWDQVFNRTIPWTQIGHDALFHGELIAGCVAAALILFMARDVRS